MFDEYELALRNTGKPQLDSAEQLTREATGQPLNELHSPNTLVGDNARAVIRAMALHHPASH